MSTPTILQAHRLGWQPNGRRSSQTPVASADIGQFLILQRFSGACDATTAELFFDRGREHQRAARNRERAAKAICGLCPILAECSLVGRADLTLEGIWGGETRKERRAARRRAPSQTVAVVAPGYPGGRERMQQAHQHARHEGLAAAAERLAIPVTTLRRLLVLYGLDGHSVAEADRG
jgi:WhiB family transcriptional regulator, redox-sensing transcriptional regulator